MFHGDNLLAKRRAPLRSHEDLIVYQKSVTLASQVLTITRGFPRSERYELVSQLRRAASSIPSNIVEGYRRKTRKEYVQFLWTAYGSCGELGTQLQLSRSQQFISEPDFNNINSLRDEVSRMLWKMIDSLSPEAHHFVGPGPNISSVARGP